jgi:hypothetical protein
MNAPFNSRERQNDTRPLAILVDGPLDPVHAMVWIWTSGEGGKELNEC